MPLITSTLITFDIIGFVLLAAQGTLLLITWRKVKPDDRFLLTLGLFYLALAARFGSGWYIRTIRLVAGQFSYDPIWIWSSFIIGILVIVTGILPFWFYIGEAIKDWFKR